MATTTTGFDPRWGTIPTTRAQELLRRGTYGHTEFTNDPVTSGFPRVLNVLRERQTAPGSSSARIPATWAPVAGLTDIPGTVWLPAAWKEKETETSIPLKASERMVTLVDVPATVTEADDVVLLTDRVSFDDAVYGTNAVFNVVQVRLVLAGVIHIRVDFARADEAGA